MMLSRQHVSVRCVYAADFSPFFSGVGWEGGGGWMTQMMMREGRLVSENYTDNDTRMLTFYSSSQNHFAPLIFKNLFICYN